ncbi:MAG: DMT family transporter [Kiritimatiellia bacterium]
MPTNRTKGILCIVASAFGFAVMGMCVRWTDCHGGPVSSFQKSFFRNLVAVLIAAPMFVRSPAFATARQVVRKNWALLLLRSVWGTAGIFCNFYALGRIPLGDAMTLNKLAPFFTVLFSWLFIRERISLRQTLCIVGAFAGALFVVKPSFAGGAPFPALVGLFGGVCAGCAYACVRELGLLKVDSRLIVLFFSAFSCLSSLPFLVFDYHPMTAAQVAILAGTGVGAAIGQFGITFAYRFAPAREIAVYDYLNVVFSALLGFLMFDQVLDVSSWIGFVLIAAMGLAMRRA